MDETSNSTINLESIFCVLRRVKKLHELTLDKGLEKQRVLFCHKLIWGLYYEPWFWNCEQSNGQSSFISSHHHSVNRCMHSPISPCLQHISFRSCINHQIFVVPHFLRKSFCSRESGSVHRNYIKRIPSDNNETV